MPKSRIRRRKARKGKKGDLVSKNVTPPAERLERFGDMESGITLQDLINVVAYQEAHGLGGEQEEIVDEVPNTPTVEDIDITNPDAQAVIRAVHKARNFNGKAEEENEDGR